ncbi:MAG: Fic family protein [Nanoarchaeota archaeon]
MVNIRERKVGNEEYYYLEHSVREGKNVVKKEVYLGKEIPKDIDKIKKKFIFDLYKEKWFSVFDKIKSNYKNEQKIMPPSSRVKAKETFAVKFTYNTQRIEGSTLSLRETAKLLERGITPDNKPINDVLEAEAHKNVFYEMLKHNGGLSMQIVLYWHKKLFERTKPDIAGKTRTHQVVISMSKFVPPMPAEIDFLLNEFFDWYKKNENKLNPVELAALVHLKFVTIHPFGDGNGRISRLMMNFVLNKFGYPMFDIPYDKRDGYYTALERSQTKKEETPFLHWFFKRYIKEYKTYLK